MKNMKRVPRLFKMCIVPKPSSLKFSLKGSVGSSSNHLSHQSLVAKNWNAEICRI